jgi:hypothetical protein
MTPHEQLPRAYLASCEKFLEEISRKLQASSATKKTQLNNRVNKKRRRQYETNDNETNTKDTKGTFN